MWQRIAVSLTLGLAACTAASSPTAEELLARAVAVQGDTTLVRSDGEGTTEGEFGGAGVTEYRTGKGGAVRRIELWSRGEEHSESISYFLEGDGEVFAIIAESIVMPAMRLTQNWDTLVVWKGKLLYQGHGSLVEDATVVGDTTAQTLEALLQRLRESTGK